MRLLESGFGCSSERESKRGRDELRGRLHFGGAGGGGEEGLEDWLGEVLK